jgi:hypothetical protein
MGGIRLNGLGTRLHLRDSRAGRQGASDRQTARAPTPFWSLRFGHWSLIGFWVLGLGHWAFLLFPPDFVKTVTLALH